jgi:hypothetical protein
MHKVPASQKQDDKAHAVKPKKPEEARKSAVYTIEHPAFSELQNHLGNGAVQRILAQRSGGDGAFDLDDATADHINSVRDGGQPLDTKMTRM